VRRRTEEWSFLARPPGEFSLLDEPLFEFAEIPQSLGAFSIWKISDRLFCLCGLRSIAIPDSILVIGSCFNSLDSPETVEIGASIESIDGFIEVHKLAFVSFAIGSRVLDVRGFLNCRSLRGIRFPPTVAIIGGFSDCRSLEQVHFESDRRLREIRGFCKCESLSEIEIPRSTETVTGITHRRALRRIIFGDRSLLRVLDGFPECPALSEPDIPGSVERMAGFDFCGPLNFIRFSRDSPLRIIRDFGSPKAIARLEIPPLVEVIEFDFSGVGQLTFRRGTLIGRICAGFGERRVFVGDGESDLRSRRRRANMIGVGD
jgi:hypothetical protein